METRKQARQQARQDTIITGTWAVMAGGMVYGREHPGCRHAGWSMVLRQTAPCPARKYVRPGKRATADGEWRFFVRRIASRARLPPGSLVGLSMPLHSSGAFVDVSKPRAEIGDDYGRDERLSRASVVAMMQAPDLRERDDLTGTEWVDRAALRTILVEREMGSRFVVIRKVGRQQRASDGHRR